MSAGLDTLIVDKDTGLQDLTSLFQAMKGVSSGQGKQVKVPVASLGRKTSKGSAVKWNTAGRKLFAELRDDRPVTLPAREVTRPVGGVPWDPLRRACPSGRAEQVLMDPWFSGRAGSRRARCWNERILGFRITPSRISIARRIVSSCPRPSGPPITVRRYGMSASLISQVAEFHR